MASLAENLVSEDSAFGSVFGPLPLWRTIGVLTVIHVAVPAAIAFVVAILAIIGGRSTNDFFYGATWLRIGVDVSYAILIAVILLGFARKVIRSRRFFAAFRWSGWRDGIWVIGGFVLAFAVCYGIEYGQNRFLHIKPDESDLARDLSQSPHSPEAFVLALSATLLIPMLEEIQFRGLLLGTLAPRFGWWPAGIVSSLIFAALHYEPHNIAVHFAFGMIVAYVVRRTATLWTSYGIHALTNALAITWVLLDHAKR